MQTTTLSFDNIHTHGTLFTNVLRARHQSFIVQRKWNLPQVDGMEFDQYDTPQSRWIAVHDGGQVLHLYSELHRDPQSARIRVVRRTLSRLGEQGR